MKEKTEPIFLNGKVVGIVDAENIFNTTRHEIFRKYNGIGISINVLKQLFDMEVSKIHVILETGSVIQEFYFNIDDFWKSDLIFNLNGDLQRFVTIKDKKQENLQAKLTEWFK